MVASVKVELDMPEHLASVRLPMGAQSRLQTLLDMQDRGQTLTADERLEAEGLVDLAEWLTLLKLSAEPSSCSPTTRFSPGPYAEQAIEGETMYDFLKDFIGCIDSSNIAPGGSDLSENTGKRFREILLRKYQSGKL